MEPKTPFETRHCNLATPIGIYSKTKYPKQAIEFLSWLTTSRESAKASGMVRGVFSSSSQREAVAASLSDTNKKIVSIAKKILDMGVPMINPRPLNYQQFQDIFEYEKSQYLYGRMTIEQMCKNIYDNANDLLNPN
jgi:ABC-type glycerol-3-phosphate transport system substrate-binding protein